MGFLGVAMEAQRIDVSIGNLDVRDVFTGEVGREAALPELVRALDFSFCLRRWSIKETNVVELERPAELGEGLGILGEKDGVIIDVDLQRSAVAQESGGEELQVEQEKLSAIKFGTDEHAGTIVEHIEHGKVQ